MAILAYDEAMLRGVSPYERMLRHWISLGASFVWGGFPNDPQSWLINRVDNRPGKLTGGASIGTYGIANPDGVNDAIYWPTSFGLGPGGLIVVLVEATISTDNGCFMHVGNITSGGMGIGCGGSFFEDGGSYINGLADGSAWITAGTRSQLKVGIKCYAMGATTSGSLSNSMWVLNGIAQFASATISGADNGLYIQGYLSGDSAERYATNKVIAAAAFREGNYENQGKLYDAIVGHPAYKAVTAMPRLSPGVYW